MIAEGWGIEHDKQCRPLWNAVADAIDLVCGPVRLIVTSARQLLSQPAREATSVLQLR
jgi:hypothetical protein